MPRITDHGVIVPTPGETLRALDKQIFSVAAEGMEKLEAGWELGDINVTIEFMRTLLRRRDVVLVELKKESKEQGVNPGELYGGSPARGSRQEGNTNALD